MTDKPNAAIAINASVLTKLKAVFPAVKLQAILKDGKLSVNHDGVEMALGGAGLDGIADGTYSVDCTGEGVKVEYIGPLPAEAKNVPAVEEVAAPAVRRGGSSSFKPSQRPGM